MGRKAMKFYALGCRQQKEVCCRGYNVMKDYGNMPEAAARSIDKDE